MHLHLFCANQIARLYLICSELFPKQHFQKNYRKGASFKQSACRGAMSQKRLQTSGVQDPDFGVQSGRIFGLFWIWIGYRFPFNRIRIRNIQMK